jgi:tripartite-type tricarboxylate transporter receptor subunit TctC
MKRLSAVLLIAAMALWLAPTHAGAAKFPNKPVRLVIPYSPGGSHDAHARAFASVMEPYLGQPMLAVIRAGGGGSIGASFVARARADGHTLILGDQQSILVKPLLESLPYSSASFVPVGRINYSPILITVKKDAPWKNLRDLIEDAKRRPGKISFGGVPGLGVDQIPMELLSLKAGIKLKFVPFQGGGPTWQAFLGGHIDIAPAFASTVMPSLSKGTVRVLAITAPDRLPQLPNLPTMKEQGYDVQFAMFRTVFASKKTPADILAKLRAAFDKWVNDKSFQSMVKRMGERVIYMSGKDFESFMMEENGNMKALVDKLVKKKK